MKELGEEDNHADPPLTFTQAGVQREAHVYHCI